MVRYICFASIAFICKYIQMVVVFLLSFLWRKVKLDVVSHMTLTIIMMLSFRNRRYKKRNGIFWKIRLPFWDRLNNISYEYYFIYLFKFSIYFRERQRNDSLQFFKSRSCSSFMIALIIGFKSISNIIHNFRNQLKVLSHHRNENRIMKAEGIFCIDYVFLPHKFVI